MHFVLDMSSRTRYVLCTSFHFALRTAFLREEGGPHSGGRSTRNLKTHSPSVATRQYLAAARSHFGSNSPRELFTTKIPLRYLPDGALLSFLTKQSHSELKNPSSLFFRTGYCVARENQIAFSHLEP